VVAYIFGVVLFAIGICLSVALHEAGHMFAAKAFGMKVRRYFIGFGPRIWSFKRGETEYGLKAIPLGGFCDIVGMTALDEVTPEEMPRAMYRFAAWKRVVVMLAGIFMQFVLGLVILYLMAVTMGLPNLTGKPTISGTDCAAASQNPKYFDQYSPCTAADPSPAAQAGMKPGDTIVAVNGKATPTWTDVVTSTQDLRGTVPFVVDRDGQQLTLQVTVATVQRVASDAKYGEDGNKLVEVGAIGVKSTPTFQYNALSGIGGTATFTGDMLVRTWEGLINFPKKIPAVVRAIGGETNDPERPVSVVGASRIGGEAVEAGIWSLFLLLLASLNFFMGLFNLLPLLPLDGGHIAITLYEKVRNWLRKLRGLPAGGPVDYTKLTTITMVVVFIGGAVVLLTVTADIVNPIRIGGQ
jgi:membrane-associated protease RseP (regulator of RpoE activity)